MNKLGNRITGGILAAVLMLVSGCASNQDSTTANGDSLSEQGKGPMGRYVEETLPLPDETAMTMGLFYQNGRLEWYGAAAQNDYMHSTFQDGAWTAQEIPWEKPLTDLLGTQEDAFSRAAIAINKEGNPYLYAQGRLFHWKDNQLTELPMKDWDNPVPEEQGAFYGGKTGEGSSIRKDDYLRQMAVLGNGDLLFCFQISGYRIYSPDGQLKKEIQVGEYSGASIGVGDHSFVETAYDRSVTKVNTDTGEQAVLPTFETSSNELSVVTMDAEENVYLLNSDGIHRMTKDGSVWETLLDGGMSAVSSPAYQIMNFIQDDQKGFYYGLREGGLGLSKLIYAHYDPNMPTVPSKTLKVYSMYDGPTLRQTIGTYQQNHTDIVVDLQIGYDEQSGAQKSDVIRALNTEILAGKGPDVLLLDGLPYQSYMEKGVLADLTSLIPEDAYSNIMKTYEMDGKIYGIPTKFTVPLLYGAQENLDKIHTPADLLGDGGEKPMIMLPDSYTLLSQMLSVSAPAWIDEKGSLDKAKLQEFFTLCNDLYQKYHNVDAGSMGMVTVSASSGGEATSYSFSESEMRFQSGESLFTIRTTEALDSLLMNLQMLNFSMKVAEGEDSGEDYTVDFSSFISLPGQVKNAYIPQCSVGVNASGKTEDAMEFVKTMLSQEVQGYPFNDGFSVLKSTLKNQIQDHIKQYEDAYKEGNGSMDLNQIKEKLDALAPLITTLNTPVLVDPILMDAVMQEGLDCLAELQTPEQAADDVFSAVSLQMQENQ